MASKPLAGVVDSGTDMEVADMEMDPAKTDYGPAPDGGLRAWLVATGAGCVSFATLGFISSFGVFQEYYMTHQMTDKSADAIAWIGSLTAFFQFFLAALSGPLFDRYGEWLLVPSAFVVVFAVMMTSLCREYWQFMLAQGLLLGAGTGCMQVPSLAAVMQWFDKKRGAALGLAISGSSVGGVIFPIALSRMLNNPGVAAHLGFGWAVRIMGFVMLLALAAAVATIRPRLPPRETTFFIWSAWRRFDYVLLVLAVFLMFLGFFTPLFFVPSYAVARGMDTTLASYLLAIINAASTFGRVIPGILADRLGRLNVLAAGGLSTGIVILCLTKATTNAGLIVFSVVFGFVSGTIISGASAAISVCVVDPRNMGTYIGMSMCVSSVAVLIGPPISGRLLHASGDYLHSTLFSGIVCLAGGVAALVSKAGTPQGMLGRV